MTAMTGGSGLAPESIGGLGLRPNVLRGLRTAASIPGLSMTRAVIVLVGCLVLSAVLFPTLLRLPRWIEFELVVAAWWVVWVVALTYLLYTGRGLIDDFRVEQLPRFGRRHAASPSTSTAMIIRPGPTDHMAPPIPLPLAPGATVDELRAAKQAALVQRSANTMTYLMGYDAPRREDQMPRRSPFAIRLSAGERHVLERQARSYTSPYWEVVRARLVLLAADGLRNDEIARRLDMPRQVVSKWRRRYFEEGRAGLADRPRGGRPAAFPPGGGRRGQGPRLPAAR